MNGQKVAVGMSGGVDSSVAAALLKEQGYDVTGVFIEAYNEPGCRTDQDKKDALQAALHLGIGFQTIDVRTEYKKKVVDYFFETYKRGATPNPDVVCNREVKFGLFYDWALAHGFDSVATGHYAQIIPLQRSVLCSDGGTTKNGPLYIQRGKDKAKDQSYFLYQVNPGHLSYILWPLGNMTKKQVREKAKELGLANADKPDSMGICMIGELNIREFLRQNLGTRPGEVIFVKHKARSTKHEFGDKGNVIGRHNGLWFHTIGQRGGFDIDKKLLKKLGYEPEKMAPLYVVGKNIKSNELIVGRKEDASRNKFSIINYQFSNKYQLNNLQTLITDSTLFVRIRNLGELEKVLEVRSMKHEVWIKTENPLFGVAEGQAAVLYARMGQEGDEVIIGGGEIALGESC